jgi:hypothetical protein
VREESVGQEKRIRKRERGEGDREEMGPMGSLGATLDRSPARPHGSITILSCTTYTSRRSIYAPELGHATPVELLLNPVGNKVLGFHGDFDARCGTKYD